MPQTARGHHTLPRFYLQGFADGKGFVNVVHLPGDVRYPQSVVKVSVINDFYNVGKGPDRDAIEKLLADEVERPAAAVFRKVLDQGIWPLDIEDRSIISTFFALQHGRGANRRKSVAEIADFISQMTRGDDGLPRDADLRSELLKRIHIETMLDFETTGPYFFGRIWTLVKVAGGGVLTCDTPISLLPFEGAPADSAVGIGTAEAILFPMSATTALMMVMHEPAGAEDAKRVVEGAYDSIFQAGDDHIAQFNQQTILNARRSVYHHPDDSGWVPDSLPPPRTSEVSIVRAMRD